MLTTLASIICFAWLLSSVTAGENSDGFRCGERTIWADEDGGEVCIALGEGICRDSGDPWGEWRFGVRDEDGVVLLDPNRDAAYMDFPGATHICIGEETLRRNPNRQPYLYIVDECNDEFLAELVCDGIDADNLSRLKMTDLDDLEKDVYDLYPLNVVKFRKGPTRDRQDDNSLWKIEVDLNSEDELEGQVVVNEEYCVWEEYYSSSRCSALDCASIECCDVYADDPTSFVFPQCKGSDYCNAINETSIFETVVVDFQGICLDLLDSVGDQTGIIELTTDQKTRLERALIEFSQDEEACSNLEAAEEGCLGNVLRERNLGITEGTEVDTEGEAVTLIEYEQIDPCVESNDGGTRRLQKRQKSKGRFNKRKKGNNRRRRRRNRRRLFEHPSTNLVLRRSQELVCPPELVLFFQEQGFGNTSAADVTEVVEKDCKDVGGDACSGRDGDFSCCGYKPECACGNVTSESQCSVFGCDSSPNKLCCSFDICVESDFCDGTVDRCEGVTCPCGQSCDPSDGTCRRDDELVPCVSVIDEDDGFGTPDQAALWAEFRARYPFRPFCLLVPECRVGNNCRKVDTPPDFDSDRLAQEHPVTRDNGDVSIASDWAKLCDLDKVSSSAVAFVGLFIDDSSSMYETEVRAARDQFIDAMDRIDVVKVVNTRENWIKPFLTTLAPPPASGNCTNATTNSP